MLGNILRYTVSPLLGRLQMPLLKWAMFSPAQDHWQFVKNAETGHFAVRHEPNLSSGGMISESSVAAFLSRSGNSPQAEALRTLLGKQGVTDIEDE